VAIYCEKRSRGVVLILGRNMRTAMYVHVCHVKVEYRTVYEPMYNVLSFRMDTLR
jgi:hypothetical protein